jgi:hypothetical protein
MSVCAQRWWPRGAWLALATALVCLGPARADTRLPGLADLTRNCLAANVRAGGRVCQVSDFDSDQRPDWALARTTGGGLVVVSIHLAGREGAIDLVPPPGLETSSYTLRDVDGDGAVDVALLGVGGQTIGVFHNDGQGAFAYDEANRYASPETGAHRYLLLLVDRGARDWAAWSGSDQTALPAPARVLDPLPAGGSVAAPRLLVRVVRRHGLPPTRAP